MQLASRLTYSSSLAMYFQYSSNFLPLLRSIAGIHRRPRNLRTCISRTATHNGHSNLSDIPFQPIACSQAQPMRPIGHEEDSKTLLLQIQEQPNAL